ncbi:MAG: hypothetical protein LUH63_09290 [Parabacteroides sp.]|nr:hypothetical protein [Parabacteroides sp.]
MRTLGNIIWHIPFLGFLFALTYALGGLFFCITVIGIPVGLGWLQFSLFLLSPFSKAMVSREDLALLTGQQQGEAMQTFSFIVRILYFPFGLFAAIGAICTIVCEFISLIGIPFGIVWAKSLSTIFNPVNKVCVPRAVAMEIERRKNEGTLNRYASGNVFSMLKGETLVIIGVLLPLCLGFISWIIFSYLQARSIIIGNETVVHSRNIFQLLFYVVGVYFILEGRIKIKEEKTEGRNAGVTLILIGCCIKPLILLCDRLFSSLPSYGYMFSSDIGHYISFALSILSTIVIIAGVIFWKCSDKESGTIGLSIICLVTILNFIFYFFGNVIAEYLCSCLNGLVAMICYGSCGRIPYVANS